MEKSKKDKLLVIFSQRPPKFDEKGDQLILFNRHKYLKKFYSEIIYIYTLNRPWIYNIDFIKTDISKIQSSYKINIGFFRFLSNFIFLFLSGFSIQRSIFSNEFINIHIINKLIHFIDKDCEIYLLYMTLRTVPDTNFLYDLKQKGLIKNYVCDFIDSISLGLHRTKVNRLLSLVYKYERYATSKDEQNILNAMSCLIVSEVDYNYIISKSKRNNLNSRLIINPNGVNIPRICSLGRDFNDKITIGFIGNLDYIPNRDAVITLIREVLPNIKIPINLYIAGHSNNQEKLYKLIKRSTIHTIIFKGKVDCKFKFFDNLDFFVAPMTSGSGIQNKILEAAGYGITTITTPIAFKPISNINGIYVSNSNNDIDFTKILIDTINIPLKNHYNFTDKAMLNINEKYSWENNSKILHDLINN